MIIYFNDFFIIKTLRFVSVARENYVASPNTSWKKYCKCKVLLTDLLCIVGIDHNYCAKKRHGRHMAVVTGSGGL